MQRIGTNKAGEALMIVPRLPMTERELSLDEVTIVDRVQVDLDDLGKLDHHVAIPPAEPVEVVYVNSETGGERRRRVYGFTAAGDALVVPDRGSRLTPAWEGAKAKERLYLQPLQETPQVPVGPFIQAPSGMAAVFKNGQRLPIVYYDVRGRALCIDDLDARSLFVVDEDGEEFVRIEGEPKV